MKLENFNQEKFILQACDNISGGGNPTSKSVEDYYTDNGTCDNTDWRTVDWCYNI